MKIQTQFGIVEGKEGHLFGAKTNVIPVTFLNGQNIWTINFSKKTGLPYNCKDAKAQGIKIVK